MHKVKKQLDLKNTGDQIPRSILAVNYHGLALKKWWQEPLNGLKIRSENNEFCFESSLTSKLFV